MATLKFYSGTEWIEVGAEKYKVGDIKHFAVEPPDSTWLLCDGSIIDSTLYPGLVKYFSTKTYPLTLIASGKYNFGSTVGESLLNMKYLKINDELYFFKPSALEYAPSVFKYLRGMLKPGIVSIANKNVTAYGGSIQKVMAPLGFVEGIGYLFYQVHRMSNEPYVVKITFRVLDLEASSFTSLSNGIDITYTTNTLETYSPLNSQVENSIVVPIGDKFYFITATGYCEFSLDMVKNGGAIPYSSIKQVAVATKSDMIRPEHIGDYLMYFSISGTGAINGGSLFSLKTLEPAIAVNIKLFADAYGPYKDENSDYYYTTELDNDQYGSRLVRSLDFKTWEPVNLPGLLQEHQVTSFSYDPLGKTYYATTTRYGVNSYIYSKFPDFRTYELLELASGMNTRPSIAEVHPGVFFPIPRRTKSQGDLGLYVGNPEVALYFSQGGLAAGTTLPNVEGGVTYIKAREEIL